jgi:hypothetical protein
VCPCAAVFRGASILNFTADSVVELCACVPRFFRVASISNFTDDSVVELCALVPRFLEGQVF